MKKLTLLISLVALIISIFSFFYFQSTSELVYVDVNKLMDGYKRTAIERAKFESKAKQLQSNVDSLVSNWQNEIKDYERERLTMSKKEIELNQELLKTKQQQISNYQQAIQNQISEEDQKASQTIINDINDYIKEFGKVNNYRIIFGASGSGNIMYADSSTDLTEEVLEGLNNQYETK
ncbi:MAG: OmpH family outer membrane protein [Flavobacterium sp.]|nr:MAG: OmpH family outer membrane protein [Flavobacterium sp.]